jgi:thiosulfate dehydrogenase (quinone) large subunit
MSGVADRLSSMQQSALVLVRTLVGWHFLYEGYFKLMQPAWSPLGEPMAPWSAAGYLRGASGPLAGLFGSLADPRWIGYVDGAIPIALVAIGLLLMLGLFTQLAATGALLLLAGFYAAAIPTWGVPAARVEGVSLIVNKTLIEAAAVLVVLVFRTGAIAGLDRLRRRVAAPQGASG